MPILSIVIPVYNTPLAYLSQCLASAAGQTTSSVELVVIDDGSSGARKASLKHLLRSTCRGRRVVFAEWEDNRGLAEARNAAVQIASGEYVLFLDSDDVIHPQLAERCRSAYHPNTALIYTNHQMVSADLSSVIHAREKSPYQRLLEEYKGSLYDPLLHSTFVMHAQVVLRDAFLDLGGLATCWRYGDEVDLHLRLSEMSTNVNFHLIAETLYLYRRNPSSIVHHRDLYARLVANIQRILVVAAKRRGFPITAARRLGLATTFAAHYELATTDGRRVRVPWFDYANQCLKV